MNEALVTRNLVKRYGRNRALDGFTLSVPVRSVLGLVGCNGAGKTTWMMTVAGFVQPTSGEINILGKARLLALLFCILCTFAHNGKDSSLRRFHYRLVRLVRSFSE